MSSSPNISRRTLAKGAAWSVPAVAVAAAAPMVAASPIITISQAGDACKLPGNSCSAQGWSKGYLQPLEICNKSAEPIRVSIQDSTLNFNGQRKQFDANPESFTIDPGDCQRVVLNLNLQDNSQNSSIEGDLKWTYVGTKTGQTGTGITSIYTASTEPCVACTV